MFKPVVVQRLRPIKKIVLSLVKSDGMVDVHFGNLLRSFRAVSRMFGHLGKSREMFVSPSFGVYYHAA